MHLNCISSWAFGQCMYLHTILHDISLTLQIDSALNIDRYRYMQRRYQTVRIFSQCINIEVVHRWTDLIDKDQLQPAFATQLTTTRHQNTGDDQNQCSLQLSPPLHIPGSCFVETSKPLQWTENKRLFSTTCSLYRHCNKPATSCSFLTTDLSL